MKLGLAAGLLGFGLIFFLIPTHRVSDPPVFAPPRESWTSIPLPRGERDAALSRAMFRVPAWDGRMNLASNPPDPSGLLATGVVQCRLQDSSAHGTTPKFVCALSDGELVKVKYGATAEIQAETAATRLLGALGFGADRVYLVPRLRCYGCGRAPFYTAWLLDTLHLRSVTTGTVPDDRFTDFEWVAVERPYPAVEIKTDGEDGWAWYELDRVDPDRGASRAEIDALRLAAVLLAHWDNKSENQRLVCLDGGDSDRSRRSAAGPGSTACARPFGFIQDLGSSFGPYKADLTHWRQVPIWQDASGCRVSLQQLPYNGGTFTDVEITEGGRRLLAAGLARLTHAQIVALFASARFPELTATGAASAETWATAFEEKVRQIADRECAPATSPSVAKSARSSGT